MLRVSGAWVSITDRRTQRSGASLPIPVFFSPVKWFCSPAPTQEKGSAHLDCGESSWEDSPAPSRNGAGVSSLLAFCMLLLGEGLSPLRRSCNELSLLRLTSEYGQPTNLCYGEKRKKKKERRWRMFFSHSLTSLRRKYPSTNPEKVRPKTFWEMLLPSFRCRKAGDYMAKSETKLMFLKKESPQRTRGAIPL